MTALLHYCPACETGYDGGVARPCPVCVQYGGIAPAFMQAAADGNRRAVLKRDPIYYCEVCSLTFDQPQKRCTRCRKQRKVDARKRTRNADNVRKKITKARREMVYARDGHRCLACGSERKLTLDHIVPLSKGGTNAVDNLQTLCRGCNCSVKRGKSTDYRSVPLVPIHLSCD